ncbi:MAG TPA: DUF3054 domain-containing protein [Kineosporiaceae bacterium]|nr:DUF3054 domain-containing protein [Kineosporiaceae bacterium]
MSRTPAAAPPPAAGSDAADRAAPAIVVDLVAVVVFVLLGRRSHNENEAVTGVLVTLWPFLTGLMAGWAVVGLRRARPLAWTTGAVLVVATVTVGMVLRHTVSHDGTPPSFVAVATTFLTIFLVGWRAVARWSARRRQAAG